MAERHEAIRTCIGCRSRAPQRELVRFVLASEAAQHDGGPLRVVQDDGQHLAGRGAWLHDDETCRQLALRRRAFRRALRIARGERVEPELGPARGNDGDGHVTSPAVTEEADGSRR